MTKESWITVAMPIILSSKECISAKVVSEALPVRGSLGVVQNFVELTLKTPRIRFVCPDCETEQEVLSFFRDMVIGSEYGIKDIIDGGKGVKDKSDSPQRED